MKWVDYASPHSIREAVDLLAAHGDDAKMMAGGTDMLVLLRAGLSAKMVVDVKDIPELNEITYDPTAGLTLGAAVPCYRIYGNAAVSNAYPGLIDAASLIGGTQIQGRASIGGNLCNAAPSGDSIPALIALEAKANIAGPDGSRQVAAEDFCIAPRRTVLKIGEIVTSIHLPPPAPNTGARYLRFIPRNEMDIAVAGVGVSVALDRGVFKAVRVALASVAPTPLFVDEVGEALVGQAVNEANVQKAADIARDAAKPITDMRGTVEYRKHLCEVLTRRALNTAIERAKEG